MQNHEPGPMSAAPATPKCSIEFLEALKQELALTTETLREPLTELMVLGYSEALSDLRVEQLRWGFRRARRTLRWFPKPCEVRELSALEADDLPPLLALPEADEPIDLAEKAKILRDLNAVGEMLFGKGAR